MEDSYLAAEFHLLHRIGPLVAAAFPRVADRLARESLDPDAERLLDGLAYLVGRLNAKADQQLDVATQWVCDVLFPNYLEAVPPCSIVQLDLKTNPLQRGGGEKPLLLRAGTELVSAPVLGTGCRFRTCYDVELGGLSLNDVRWESAGAGVHLSLDFSFSRLWLDAEGKDAVRLHLHGEPLITRSLLEWLCTRVDHCQLIDATGEAGTPFQLDIRPAGFEPEQSLLEFPLGAFHGFRLLQEYLLMPQKFSFVDIEGLRAAVDRQSSIFRQQRRFTLRFALSVAARRAYVVDKNSVRLNCTPVVNLFQAPADPIKRNPQKDEELLRPSGLFLHYQIHRVLDVVGRRRRGGYVRYRNLIEAVSEGEPKFSVVRRGFADQVYHYLRMGGFADDEEVLMVDLLCSNGVLPSGLQIGDINTVEGRPQITCGNLSVPTPFIHPAIGPELRKRLMVHLGLSQKPLWTLQALRDAIWLYDFGAAADLQRRNVQELIQEGLVSVERASIVQEVGGYPANGFGTTLTVDESAFESRYETYLFGCVLSEFVALQAGINELSEFCLKRLQTRDSVRWDTKIGHQRLQH